MCAPPSRCWIPLTPDFQTVPASEAIAILAAELVDPLFGIGALRSGLEDELGVDPASEVDAATSKAYALALRCLGRCLGRLPAAVLEDEVVRVRSFIVKVRASHSSARGSGR